MKKGEKKGTRDPAQKGINKILPSRNRSAMQLSFGMIFSIILIIAFLVFAFYAIKIFLSIQEKGKVAAFRDNLQTDVDRVWRGAKASQEETYNLPSKIKQACFADDIRENLKFYPIDAIDGLGPIIIKNINITYITSTINGATCHSGKCEFCLNNTNGKIKMILKKILEKNWSESRDKMSNDNGLVDEYERLQNLKQDLENKIEKLKEDIIILAKQKNTDVLFGINKKCSIKEYARIIYPEDKQYLIELIKRKGIYEKFSSINYLKLGSAINKGETDDEIQNLIKKEKAFRLSLLDIQT